MGQMMWQTARTRPDISACLGSLASLMVRRPKQAKAHLTDLVWVVGAFLNAVVLSSDRSSGSKGGWLAHCCILGVGHRLLS